MKIKKLLGLALTMTIFNAYADDHCSDLTTAVELSTFCNSASGICALSAGSTYKITQDTGSLAAPLLPVKIPATSTLCVVNSATPAPINIVAQSFWVDGGIFQIGSPTDPIKSTNKVTITMTGTASAAAAPMPLCQGDQAQCSEIAKNTIATQNARDITVSSGGQLLFYGAKGLTKRADGSYIHTINHTSGTVDGQTLSSTAGGSIISGDINQFPYFNNVIGSNSWTYLTYPAGPSFYDAAMWVQAPVSLTNYGALKNISTGSGASIPTPTLADMPYIIALAKRVTPGDGTDWQSGDWISISTTSFVSHETEIVQICAIYDMQNPDSNAQSESRYMEYGNVSGSSNYPNVSVVVLAGSPSFKSQCPSISNDTPLKHYHFGSLPPTPGFFSVDTPSYKGQYNAKKGQAYSMYDDATRNFGIDERAEVALLSRNIKLTSTAGVTSSSPITHLDDTYFGGHIAVMNHSMSDHQDHAHGTTQAADSAPDVTVQLVGVELEKFGQPLVGRYPVHFHRLNADSLSEDSQLLVQDVSVHHSFNKCFVTHDTMGVKFYNNSCVRTIGQAFYLEDGHNIADNQYVRNLVQGAMAAALKYDITSKNVVDVNNNPIGKNTFWDGDYLVATGEINYNPSGIPDTSNSGANTGNFVDSFAPSGFWITTFGRQSATNSNLPNLFVNNSVAGCQIQGAAYWFVRQDVNSMGEVGSTPEADLYPVFTGNRGHACYDGVMAGTNFFVMKTTTTMGAPPKPVPVGSEVNPNANAPLVIFDSLTLTQIQQKAFWYRGVFVAVNNSRFSMLKQGMTLLGGGGPEGNLLGFYGLVNNSVFAGVTNNNVGRYIDCEEYYKLYSDGTSELTATDALPVAIENEIGQCVPVNPNDISKSKASTNMQTAAGDIYLNYNFQGYTFYDGPARMENNRFVNFRADPTNSALYDNSTESYSTSESRYLVTKIDAHRMMNFDKTGQLSAPTGGNNYKPGGNSHYGYNGDVAFSWLKGNAQSVPPTQYAKNNLWDNVNFQHQVFTEISNLSNGLDDGDKQTVEIDKDASLSGYKVCSSKMPSSCSNAGLNHYPISLNNLEYFSTDYTVDEPHSRGRNNATASALMSPHQYASINVAYNAADRKVNPTTIYPLTITRDMAYQANPSQASYTGRGGKNYMFEAMVMNNMGYTFDSQLKQQMQSDQADSPSNKLIFSYSDAPVHSTFINRVGICVGKNASNIEIYKVPRQWNSLVTYLTKSPYWSGYGLTATGDSCPNSIDKPDSAYHACKKTAGGLSSPWGKVLAYNSGQADGYKELNKQFAKAMTANYNLTPSTSADLTEGFYYDSSSGILYFNMIQYAASSTLANPITPPFATCDKSNYNTTNIDALVDYLTFSNPDAIKDILTTACYAESGTPVTSELLTCPPEGCAVYTVGFDVASASEPSCTPSAWATIKNGSSPSFNTTDSAVTYSSPYVLYNATSNTQVTPQNRNVKAQGSISTLTRYYNIDPSITPAVAPTDVNNLLPLASAASNGQTYVYNAAPSGISMVSYPSGGGNGGHSGDSGTVWTFNTGADEAAGQKATITAADGEHFYNTNDHDNKIASYTIEPTLTGNNFSFKYGGVDKTATVTLPNELQGQQTCSLTFNQSSNGKVTKGTEAGCAKITIPESNIAIIVSH
ncbi:G8 domain-containing protein [Cysteiniphilum sp. QT6929]|uniref:G8 domain-containing protein n=1 Tax=Cysteiniphilum sp. QT6929 TaxID=2975055 RepID=UPI0024B35DA5|nr:G8 domain-containing protein [Cysteiniphilum sp. QT6929]WHN64559.1 hypothetical protein NYP54_05710 [Cysteiniphilum sp. QT6929]